jgi:hypothetical protein
VTEERKEGTAEEPAVSSEGEPPSNGRDGPAAGKKKSFWQEARIPVLAAVAGSLVLIIAPPARNWGLGAADEIKDVIVSIFSYDEHLVDNVKERISHRPGWTSGPKFLSGSVDYLDTYIDAGAPDLNELEGLRPTILSVDELVERGVEYDGIPVTLVGRLTSREILSGGTFADVPTEEVLLAGVDPSHVLIVGAGGRAGNSTSQRAGELVVVQGVLAATGHIRDPSDETEVESGYFVALQVVGFELGNPFLKEILRRFN